MTPALEIDALGLLCPLPVLRLRKRIAGLPAGSIVQILADDPAAQIDIPHFCAESGHKFLSFTELTDHVATDGKTPGAYLLQTAEST